MQESNQHHPKPLSSPLRCAIYTRKSTEEGLEQEFNSLAAQREAAEAYIKSQRREGWIPLPENLEVDTLRVRRLEVTEKELP